MRTSGTPAGQLPFTAQEETERDSEEAQDAAEAPKRERVAKREPDNYAKLKSTGMTQGIKAGRDKASADQWVASQSNNEALSRLLRMVSAGIRQGFDTDDDFFEADE